MNTNIIKLAVVAFLGILIVSGCNQGTPKPYYKISDEFKEYCYFTEGSSWVFQNDSTLVTDSINITELKDKQRFNPEPVQYHYQAVDMFLNTNVFQILRYEITAGNEVPDEGEMNSLLRKYLENGNYQIVFSPKYPMGEEIILGDEIGVYENVEIIGDLELNGNSYKDVWHTNVKISHTSNIEHNYWIAKNYGLIKTVTTIDGVTTSISLKTSNLLQK